eukprot:SAG31_NODE_23154_length_510_cov_0.749392_1_plen_113_part_01
MALLVLLLLDLLFAGATPSAANEASARGALLDAGIVGEYHSSFSDSSHRDSQIQKVMLQGPAMGTCASAPSHFVDIPAAAAGWSRIVLKSDDNAHMTNASAMQLLEHSQRIEE